MKLLGKKIYRVGLKPYKNGIGQHDRGPDGDPATGGNPSSGCCVHPDTRISMADGTTKAAKDIRIGDELMTQAGTGKVEIIANPQLGYRSLYSYGRGSYFITGDHPIHADGEWKSLMPGFSKLDYDVDCKMLEKGAVLTLINGDKVKLEKIEGETNNPNLVLYDFHMDGDEDANHTYFANGLLVHNGGGGGGGLLGRGRGGGSRCGGGYANDLDPGAYYGTHEGALQDESSYEGEFDDGPSSDQTAGWGGGDTLGGEQPNVSADSSLEGGDFIEAIGAQEEAETTPSELNNPDAGVTGESPAQQLHGLTSAPTDKLGVGPSGTAGNPPSKYSSKPFNPATDISGEYNPQNIPQGNTSQQAGVNRPASSPSSQTEGYTGLSLGFGNDKTGDAQTFVSQGGGDIGSSGGGKPFAPKPPEAPTSLGLGSIEELGEHIQSSLPDALEMPEVDEFDNQTGNMNLEKPGDPDPLTPNKLDEEGEKFKEDQKFKDDLAKAEGEKEDQNYVQDLKDMWDNFEERPTMTPAEVQRLKDEGYIQGADLPDVAQGGGAPHPVNLDLEGDHKQTYVNTADVADTQSKLEAGGELGQVDYQNIANMTEEGQIAAQKQLNPEGSLDGVLSFGNLTGTSPVNHMSQANFAEMARTGQGFADLSMEDKRNIIYNGVLPPMSLEAVSQLPPKDKDDYWTMRTEQVGGVPIPKLGPDGLPLDQDEWNRFNKIKNETLADAYKNDPAFMNKRIEANINWAAKKGLNLSRQAARKLAHMALSGKFAEIAGALGGAAMGGFAGAGAGAYAGKYLTSKMIKAIMKGPNKKAHKTLHEALNQVPGLKLEQLGAYGDAMEEFESSPEGQTFIDNYLKDNPHFDKTVQKNWNSVNGVGYDPNALDGDGATTALYGYTNDGIPMTREEATEKRGPDWVQQREVQLQKSGTITSPVGTTGESLVGPDQVSSGSTYIEGAPGTVTGSPKGSEDDDDSSGGIGPGPGSGGDTKPPKEILDKGGDVPTPTTGGGTRDERWERFMDLMEKRATGEAPSLSEAAMRREREEGLKERMAMMAMGRGQPTAAGLRTYDRAKGAADAELARDSAIARLKEQQAAQGQYGEFLTEKLGQESRERIGAMAPDAELKMKQMTLDGLKTEADRVMWLDIAKNTWKIFGNDIENWIKDGWDKYSAKQAIESQGGEVSDKDWNKYSQHPAEGGNTQDYSAPPNIYDPNKEKMPDSDKDTTWEQDEKGYYRYDADSGWWYWEEYHEGGKVEGPGTETSDDIPALLSDGEFVIKASAVKGLGRSKGAKNDKEARKKGIDLLYKLQEKYGDMEEFADGGAAFGDILAARRRL